LTLLTAAQRRNLFYASGVEWFFPRGLMMKASGKLKLNGAELLLAGAA
jgi:hypothetical protein